MENGAESHSRVILEIHYRCEENSYGGNCSGGAKEQRRGQALHCKLQGVNSRERVLSETTEEPWMQGCRHTLPQEAWIYMKQTCSLWRLHSKSNKKASKVRASLK